MSKNMSQMANTQPVEKGKRGRPALHKGVRVERKTQEERRSEAEAKLLDAAREIVARKGWVGMTLGDVGIAAGYSRGIATHYFGSKTELLRSLSVKIGQNFMEGFMATPRQPGFNTIVDFITFYLCRDRETGWSNTRALLILMAEGTTDDSGVGANLVRYNLTIIAFLAEHFAHAMAVNEILTDVAPNEAAIALLGTVRGILLQKLLKDSAIDLDQVNRAVLITTIRAFAKRPDTWLNKLDLIQPH